MLRERFHRLRSVLDRRQPDLTLLMERVNKEHNLSAILRNCDAVGVLEVHAVPPDEGLTLHHDASGGTAKWMKVRRHPGVTAAVEHFRERDFRIVAADAGEGAVDYRELDYTEPTALLMGAELYGVSPEARGLADARAGIPMMGMARSLNVSVAASLLLYEAYRQRERAGLYDESRLTPERYRRILFEWAYPRFARRYREAGMAYPPLGDDGEILGPPVPGRRPPHLKG